MESKENCRPLSNSGKSAEGPSANAAFEKMDELELLFADTQESLPTLKNCIFWINLSKNQPNYICLHDIEGIDEQTNLGEITALKKHSLHAQAPKREITFDSVTFRVTNYKAIYKKPMFHVEPLEGAPLSPVRKLLERLFRHARPFYFHTNISTTVLEVLAPAFPKSITSMFFTAEGQPALQSEMLRAIEQLPNLTDFAASPLFTMKLSFYDHPRIRNLRRFRYAGPQYQHDEGLMWAILEARRLGHEYIPRILQECVNDEVLVAVKWEDGEIWNVNATAAGLRQVLIDWLKKKREFKQFQLKLAEFKTILKENVIEGLPVVDMSDMGRVVLERRQDNARLQVLFLPDMNRMGYPGMSVKEYERVDTIYIQRL